MEQQCNFHTNKEALQAVPTLFKTAVMRMCTRLFSGAGDFDDDDEYCSDRVLLRVNT